MSNQSLPAKDSPSSDAIAVQTLYRHLLQCWNERDAAAFASLFEENGNSIGFDGSQMNGRSEIESALSEIFNQHQTGTYVGKIREARFLTPQVAFLNAVAGMVPAGKSELVPALNAIQTMVACEHEGNWLIALFQNTPAQFHGRPELTETLTGALRELL